MELPDKDHRELEELLSKPLAYHIRLRRIVQWIAVGALFCNIAIVGTLYQYPNLPASRVLPYCLLLAVGLTAVCMLALIGDCKLLRIVFHLASESPKYREADDA
jgi:hypothetical protein